MLLACDASDLKYEYDANLICYFFISNGDLIKMGMIC